MNTPFDEMPDSSRVWIYQSNKSLEPKDAELIRAYTEEFLTGWAAHGASLKGSYKILHNQFLVLAVDESFNKASGCSIDASVAVVRRISEELNLDFFDRSKVYYLDNEEIKESSLADIKKDIKAGKISKETLTFNNLVPTLGDFKSQWLTPATNSWLARYF